MREWTALASLGDGDVIGVGSVKLTLPRAEDSELDGDPAGCRGSDVTD